MSILWSLLVQSAPVYIAATGALMSELSGRLNIGLEGAILFGAFFATLAYMLIPSSMFALACAVLIGCTLGYISGWLSIQRGANIFIVGLGVNLLATGLIPLLSRGLAGSKGVISLSVSLAFQQRMAAVSVVLALAIGVLSYLFFHYHDAGLRLKKIFLDEYGARVLGTAVERYQMFAISISSALAALGGGLIALHLGSYVPNLSSGKGWIALVAVYLGDRKPLRMFGAAFIFSITQLLTTEAQRFIQVPGLLLGLPYLLTLLALIIYRMIRRE